MGNDDEVMYIPVPDNQQAPQGVPAPNRIDRADFVDKIKPEHIIELFRHKLLGEEWDMSGGKWVKVESLKAYSLSERGAWEISNVMLGVGSLNLSISRLKSEQINSRLKNIIDEINRLILSNWKEYNIRHTGQIYYIKSLVFSNALSVLSQAGDGSIQELFKTTVQENRTVTENKKEPGRLRRLLEMG